MNRRTFLNSSMLISGSFLVPNFLKATANSLSNPASKKLIIVQLSGGNDGLNTLVPFEDDLYHQYRPRIALSRAQTNPISDNLGLHSSLKNLHQWIKEGKATAVNNVGYPNPNRSHFRSMDIWQSGSDADQYENTGWLGRYLDQNCAQSPSAIELNSALSLALKGHSCKGYAIPNPKLFYNTSRDPFFQSVQHAYQKANPSNPQSDLDFLYKTHVNTQQCAAYIGEKHKLYKGTVAYPKTALGKKLKQTAQYILSGLDCSIYYVDHTGFDTHANQQRTQAALLKTLDDSLGAFVQELEQHHKFKDSLILVFSEFGRRVKENKSAGTDHGTANVVFLLSGSIKAENNLIQSPNLRTLDGNGDLNHTVDFRQIYSTILSRWLQTDANKVLQKSFAPIPFL